jgi:hypothetical protein
MGAQPLRPGLHAWRIGSRAPQAVRCLVQRLLADGTVEVRASRFTRGLMTLPQADVFADRESCRLEIQRRQEASNRL